MIITGTIECIKCGKDIKWFNQLSQHLCSSLYDCDCMPNDRVRLIAEKKRDNGKYLIPLSGYVICKNCDTRNFIEQVKYNEEL